MIVTSRMGPSEPVSNGLVSAVCKFVFYSELLCCIFSLQGQLGSIHCFPVTITGIHALLHFVWCGRSLQYLIWRKIDSRVT